MGQRRDWFMIRGMPDGSPLAILLCLAGIVESGCGSQEPEAPPVATATVTLDRERVAAGSALEITYKFDVADGATFDQDYRVFAHVKDSDGERIWDDDHNPPVPTSEWKAGQTIRYTRTVFVPVFPVHWRGHAGNRAALHFRRREATDAERRVSRAAGIPVRASIQPQTET